MQTSLRYDSRDRRLKVHVKEKFAYPDDASLAVAAVLNTQDGSVSARAVVRKSFFPKSLRVVRRVDVGTTYSTSEDLSYGVAAKLHVDVTDDGLLSLDARGGAEVTGRALGSAVARMSGGGVAPGTRGPGGGRKLGGGGSGGARGGGGSDVVAGAKVFAGALQLTGRVELTQVILGFNGPQDLKLCLGYDIGSKQPYARVKENNWALHTDFKGRWNVQYEL